MALAWIQFDSAAGANDDQGAGSFVQSADQAMLRAFERAQRRRCLSRRTIDGRRVTLGMLAEWLHARGMSMRSAVLEDIETWLDGCRLKAQSRATYLSQVRAFYAWALDSGHIPADPTVGVLRPRVGRSLPRPIATDDLAKLMVASQGQPRTRLWLCLGAYQGLRTVEMAGLSLGDVVTDRQPGYILVRAGKGAKERTVPLNPHTAEALRLYDGPPRGPMFTLLDGSAMRPQTVGTYIGRFMHANGVNSSAHPLRHWFATQLYALTRDIRVVQEMLGHADPKTTSVYTAFDQASAIDAVCELSVGG